MYNKENCFDVVILGAGLAGLGAALTLKDKLHYKIMEAQNYIGGRIFSAALKSFKEKVPDPYDSIVEGGAQWIHDKNSALYEIAQKRGLISEEHSTEALGSYIRDDGYIYETQFVEEVNQTVTNILKKCENFCNSRDFPISVEDFLQVEFGKANAYKNRDDFLKALELLDWHLRFQVIDNSCTTMKDVSARAWGQYSCTDDCQNHFNVKPKFNYLIKVLVEEIGVDKFLLQQEICGIDWSLQNKDKLIIVRNANNEIFYAKHVIVTFSIGVLKEIKSTLFNPNLPKNYNNAIESIGFATINKIFLQFDQQLCKNFEGIQFVYRNHNQKDRWTRYISGFDTVSPGPPNTLVGWVGGKGAEEMESLSDDQIIEDCVKMIRQFTNLNISYPKKYYISRWKKNKFVGGGYSYISVTCDKLYHDRKVFSQPIICLPSLKSEELIPLKSIDENHEIMPSTILFAGEGYHANNFSTAHGAFLSGIETANKILKE